MATSPTKNSWLIWVTLTMPVTLAKPDIPGFAGSINQLTNIISQHTII